jgi:hypoxanthine-DNA glycosylase
MASVVIIVNLPAVVNQKSSGPIFAEESAAAQPPRWQGLAPQFDARARWLVLGSFPGVASLKAQQYYGHPRNQFWRLLGDVFGLPLSELAYEERLLALRRQGVALWDVISETEREGSLDSKIREPRASDLAWLLAQLPGLHTIGFNGGTAARIGRRQLLGLDAAPWRLLELPSSSPAYTMAYDAKLASWQALGTLAEGVS